MIEDKEEFEDNFDDFDEEDCPYSHMFLSLLTMPKPLGYMWTLETIEEFLKKRGYKIIEHKNSEGEEIKIAIKPTDSRIPDLDSSNLRDVFYEDVQKIIFNWLLKIGSEE